MSHRLEYASLVRDTLAFLNPEEKPPPVVIEEPQIISPPPPKVETPPAPPVEKEVIKPLELNPLKPKTSGKDASIKSTLGKIAPNLKFVDEVPSDKEAKRVKEAYLSQKETPSVPIVVMGSAPPLLKSVAKAINIVYGSSHIVDGTKFEREKTWDLFLKSPGLKLILMPDVALWGALDLMRFYREVKQENKRFLGDVPLILIPDLTLYDKDPQLKRSLWNVITQTHSRVPE
ncbi:MAG: hypothetical protein SP1CHLAM54_02950 [Chlamydiia bacterium]|nr:hypothetical protein [Chlamydiia bacterium]MCH9615211.1 hypothetical protein [Chlamydiia bacterium]MCH9628467.1 hypothetical protein [Chlamydiia bacterium]